MSFVVRGSTTVGLKVTGLKEAINALTSIMNEWPATSKKAIEEGVTVFYKDAVKNAHVITGKTKASIHIESVTPKIGVISAGFGMPFEEKRGGQRQDTGTPHKTFTAAAKVTATEMPTIIKRNFDALFSKHKTQ